MFAFQTTNTVEQTNSSSNIELYILNTDVANNTNGMGVKFNSEDLKLKLSKNFIKTGVVAKFITPKPLTILENEQLKLEHKN